MCGRFTLTETDTQKLALALGIPEDQVTDDYRPRWNVAPTDPHWIDRLKREERELLPAKWGLIPFGSKDAKRAFRQINARADTLATRPAFRNAWRRHRRCAVPVDGFFEWVGPKEARQPVWFHRPDHSIFLLAGLYESWQPHPDDHPDEWQRTFTIITTDPNAVVRPIHDRMPVVLPAEGVDDWLFQGNEDLEAAAAFLRPAPDDSLVATPVSPRVNSVKNDDPACVEPVEYELPAAG
jgi:putative SOS response-associated peptidase YedK